MRHSRQSKLNHSRQSCSEYIKSFDFQNNFFFAITMDSILVATATATYDEVRDSHNVGFLVGREFSGQGFGTQIWKQYVNDFLPSIGITRLSGGTQMENIAMQRLFKTTHFRQVDSHLETHGQSVCYERF
jgi:RimJ/RimL family protein N-acetyltransferase